MVKKNNNNIAIKKSKQNSSFLTMVDSVSEIMLETPVKFLIRMSNVVFHDMSRYVNNTHNEVKT